MEDKRYLLQYQKEGWNLQPLFLDVVEVVNVFDLCNVLLGNQHALHGIDQVKSHSTKKDVVHSQVKTVICKIAFLHTNLFCLILNR